MKRITLLFLVAFVLTTGLAQEINTDLYYKISAVHSGTSRKHELETLKDMLENEKV